MSWGCGFGPPQAHAGVNQRMHEWVGQQISILSSFLFLYNQLIEKKKISSLFLLLKLLGKVLQMMHFSPISWQHTFIQCHWVSTPCNRKLFILNTVSLSNYPGNFHCLLLKKIKLKSKVNSMIIYSKHVPITTTYFNFIINIAF